MDQFYVKYRYAQYFNSFYAWVDIKLTIDKSRYNNVQAVFSIIYKDIGLDDKYFKIESGKAASAMIKWNTIDDHSSLCEGCFYPKVLHNKSLNII
jgi:hypothetical protein